MVVSVSNRDAMMMEPIGVIRGVSNSNKAYWPSLALEKRWERGEKGWEKVEMVEERWKRWKRWQRWKGEG